MLNDLLCQFPICRKGDVLLVDCCIYPNFSYFPAYKVLLKEIYALLKDPLHSFRANPVTKVYKITRIKWKFVLKIYLSAKVLPIGIFQVACHNCFISKAIHLLKQ